MIAAVRARRPATVLAWSGAARLTVLMFDAWYRHPVFTAPYGMTLVAILICDRWWRTASEGQWIASSGGIPKASAWR